MKTLLGVLLLSLTALFTCSDTQASRTVKAKHECQFANQSHCLETMENPQTMESVKDIPPVGCAIPIAQLEKVWQAQ